MDLHCNALFCASKAPFILSRTHECVQRILSSLDMEASALHWSVGVTDNRSRSRRQRRRRRRIVVFLEGRHGQKYKQKKKKQVNTLP